MNENKEYKDNAGEAMTETDASYEKYIREHNESSVKTDTRTLIGVILGSLLSAFNIAVFINAANLVPGGFNGLSVLIQRIVLKFFGTSIPFWPLSLMFNIIPAAFAFKIIGKKYTLFSFFRYLLCRLPRTLYLIFMLPIIIFF